MWWSSVPYGKPEISLESPKLTAWLILDSLKNKKTVFWWGFWTNAIYDSAIYYLKRFSLLRNVNKMYRGLVGILKPIIIFIFPYCKFYLYLNVYLNFLCILQIDIVHLMIMYTVIARNLYRHISKDVSVNISSPENLLTSPVATSVWCVCVVWSCPLLLR